MYSKTMFHVSMYSTTTVAIHRTMQRNRPHLSAWPLRLSSWQCRPKKQNGIPINWGCTRR